VPELPEVEALARFLRARATGATVARVDVVAINVLKTVDPPPGALAGLTVTDVTRHGKFLDVDVDGLHLVTHLARAGWLHWRDELPTGLPRPGKGPLALRVHLDLSTRPGSGPAGPTPAEPSPVPGEPTPAGPTPAEPSPVPGEPTPAGSAPAEPGPAGLAGFDLTEAGTQKRLAVWIVRDPVDVPGIAALGPDPLDPAFDRDRLAGLLSGPHARTRIKGLLRDQSVLAGVGNAYSDEILHSARLSPYALAGSLTAGEVERLYDALRTTLAVAVERATAAGVGTLKAEKKAGLRVHGRAGQPCPVCGDTIREVSFADSALDYCPTCQTGGRTLADRRLSRLLK
jgi:formamidopyrimidine-DNA glycosylase